VTILDCPCSDATNNGDCVAMQRTLISAPKLSKHSTTSQSPLCEATNNGDCPQLSRTLISAPESSKHLTISQCPCDDTSADINLRSNFGQSPLIAASQRGHCDVVKCLFSYGVDINVCDNFGQSPFFVASYHGHVDVVKCLYKLISALVLSNHLTTSKCPWYEASNSGDSPPSSRKLISAPFLSRVINMNNRHCL
jgi:ankyrin repeat protein